MPQWVWQFPARVHRVIDGDSVVLTLDLGLRLQAVELRCRLWGINTPERTTNPQGWAKARQRLVELLRPEDETHEGRCIAKTHKDPDNFGRWLVELVIALPDSTLINVNDLLIEEGLAIEYRR